MVRRSVLTYSSNPQAVWPRCTFFAIAANLATIPGHIETVKIYLLEKFAIEDAVFWHLFSAFVVSFVLLISYGLLAFWLARKAVGIRNNVLIGCSGLAAFFS